MPDQTPDPPMNSPDLIHSLIREVQLLLDFISGIPDRRVKDLEIGTAMRLPRREKRGN